MIHLDAIRSGRRTVVDAARVFALAAGGAASETPNVVLFEPSATLVGTKDSASGARGKRFDAHLAHRFLPIPRDCIAVDSQQSHLVHEGNIGV